MTLCAVNEAIDRASDAVRLTEARLRAAGHDVDGCRALLRALELGVAHVHATDEPRWYCYTDAVIDALTIAPQSRPPRPGPTSLPIALGLSKARRERARA